VLARPSSPQPLRVVVAPVARAATLAPMFATPAVLLFLHDAARLADPPNGLLRRLYELTPREAELATLLGAGVSLDAAADALGIAKNTAVNHLQRIFRKTGTRRQAELTRLLSSLPHIAGLDGSDG
jgi:DNA-binding CsgD family transcriptional regulator